MFTKFNFYNRIAAMLVVISVATSGSLLANSPAMAASEAENTAMAEELTTLFRSARAVISKNQAHINDASVGDKGLNGETVSAQAKVNYQAASGHTFEMAGADSDLREAQQAFFDAIAQVMAEAQPLINEQGKGFKGFLPAVFAKGVADKFSANTGGKMSIKLTAPKAYVRNRKNRPDAWENSVIEEQFKSAGWQKGQPFFEVADYKGHAAYRYILPEYYGESCLSCHGGPKGERDITGGLKEGGVLGELGGAISLSIASN